jgi:hypothetical protein
MADDDNDIDVIDQAPPDETASARTPFQPVLSAAAVEEPGPGPSVRQPFQPGPAPSDRQPFQPVVPRGTNEQDPFAPGVSLDITQGPGSGAEAAAAQQGWQYASAGGGAPRAQLVKGVAPPVQAAWDQAQAFKRQGELDTLKNIFATTQDPTELYNKLDKPIGGTWDPLSQTNIGAVSDPVRTAARDTFKNQIDKATSQVTPGAVATEFWNQVTGNLQDLQLTMNKGVANIDQEHIKEFLDTALPGQSDAEKQAFLQQLYNTPREQRATILDAYIPYTATGIPSSDPQYLISAMDRLSDPTLQAQQRAQLAQNEAEVRQKLADVPGLAGTPWPFIARAIGQIPRAGLSATVPPLMFADLFRQVRDGAAQEHPDWTDDKLDEFASRGAIAQLVPQEILGRLLFTSAGPIFRDIKSGVLRATATVGFHSAAGAALGAAGQASANLATGQPITQGLGEAAGAGAIMGGVPGVAHAVPALLRPPEAPVTPPAEAPAPPAVPERTMGPSGARIRGPEAGTLEAGQAQAEQAPAPAPPTQPAPEAAPQPQAEQPAAPPVTEQAPPVEQPVVAPVTEQVPPVEQPPPVFESASHNMQPLGYRAAVRLTNGEVFTGIDHASALDNAAENGSIRVTDDTTNFGFVGKDKNFVTMDEADRILERNWYEQQAQKAVAKQPPPVPVSEAEPINSAIANRYTQERMAAGELGQIDPSQGKSTEEMLQQGLQMTRNQRDGLIDNLMKGKGGNLDQQGAAIRSREALLSRESRDASRAAAAEPANQQLQAQAKAAFDAVTAFHNGPVKKFKQVWSDSGRALQQEIPLDYTTLNGMKEAYLKGNNKEVPPSLEPRLEKMAEAVSKSADAERTALNDLSQEIGKRTRGKPLATDDQIRTRLMEIMRDLPCPT